MNFPTEAASYSVIIEILIDMTDRLSVGGIFCDLEKAFDCVNHGIVVSKLEFYGIVRILIVIQSYLRGRYQKGLIGTINAYDGVSSGWKNVINGVPPGFDIGFITSAYLY